MGKKEGKREERRKRKKNSGFCPFASSFPNSDCVRFSFATHRTPKKGGSYGVSKAES